MPSPQEKLAQSLELLKHLQDEGRAAIRAKDLSRAHRERLLKNGFLQEVMKGWYITMHPDDQPGATTPWYSSFWSFCADYFNDRFSDEWCLSPEQSISLHVGNRTVPEQLQVRTPKGGNKPTELLHGTSVFDTRLKLPSQDDITQEDNLRIYKLPMALIEAVSTFFARNSTDARAALAAVPNASLLLSKLLEGGRSTIAGRLCGAFRNIGRNEIADEIKKTMESAGYDIREADPFEDKSNISFPDRVASPYAGRIRLMWQKMRSAVIEHFPAIGGMTENVDAYLRHVEDVYATDAYHSLSIEGYQVSPDLIERVRSGEWNPEKNVEDRQQRDALAARGYHQAFQVVTKSVHAVLNGRNAGAVARRDHGDWYREMFAPLVTTGLLNAGSLAGYRNSRVYLRGSRHVPVSGDAVSDVMPIFFELLEEEEHPAARVVLGHFVFVYIHPYMDGNGRIGRFVMNVMLAAGGYPWTVIPIEQRDDYMASLENASVQQDIVPFTKFLGHLVKCGLDGEGVAKLPESRY